MYIYVHIQVPTLYVYLYVYTYIYMYISSIFGKRHEPNRLFNAVYYVLTYSPCYLLLLIDY